MNSQSSTPILDAALVDLTKTLRRVDEELTDMARASDIGADSKARALQFRERIRTTLLQLEPRTWT